MEHEKTLLKNTLIYAVANFGSKILALLIVPLYTHFIGPDELGVYDLIITTITLLVPILTFQMNEGVYRWLLDFKQEPGDAIRAAMGMVIRNCAIATLLFAVSVCLFTVPYAACVYILLLLYSFVPILQQIARGLGNNKLYAFSGVLLTAVFLLGNVAFVVFLHMGCVGMLIAQIAAYAATGILLLRRCPQVMRALKRKRDAETQRGLLRYSLPLVPNAINWWAINASNRYIILAFLGTAANGIYAVSTKFPSLLYMCTSIFYLAWQESAITTAGAGNAGRFSSAVFGFYAKLLFALTGFLIPATRVIVERFMAAAYADAWQYCGLLYIGMAFSALSSFLGTAYQVAKETKGALYTSLISAAVSVLLCFGLIRTIGLQAVSLSFCVSYVVLFSIRWRTCSRYMGLSADWRRFWPGVLYVAVMTAVVPALGESGNLICTGVGAVTAVALLAGDMAALVKRTLGKGENKE